MIKLPPSPAAAKKKRARANETNSLVRPILSAINALEWANAWRNNVGVLQDEHGTHVRYGLAVGSSDIVGLVRCEVDAVHQTSPPSAVRLAIGRFFALEIKQPGKKPNEDQERFLEVVRKMGGAAAWVTGISDAMSFIARARDPRNDR
jgi:hypothetical protein